MYIKRTYFGENQFCQIWRFVLVFASIKDSDVAIRQMKFLEKKSSFNVACGSLVVPEFSKFMSVTSKHIL